MPYEVPTQLRARSHHFTWPQGVVLSTDIRKGKKYFEPLPGKTEIQRLNSSQHF